MPAPRRTATTTPYGDTAEPPTDACDDVLSEARRHRSNDQMIYHLTLKNCGGDANAAFHFAATWSSTAGESRDTTLDSTVDGMKAGAGTQVEKVVALVDAARAIGGAWKTDPDVTLDEAITRVEAAPDDDDLDEVLAYLQALRDLC